MFQPPVTRVRPTVITCLGVDCLPRANIEFTRIRSELSMPGTISNDTYGYDRIESIHVEEIFYL